MSLVRVNGAGWSVGAKLTSAQANALDISHTNALDKRAGQTDTLGSVVAASGAGRIIDAFTAGPNADSTLLVSGAISTVDCFTSLTANRIYTLSNTGAVAGDRCEIRGNPTYDLTVRDASANTLAIIGSNPTGTSQAAWAEFKYNGTAWILWRMSSIPQGAAITRTATKGVNQQFWTEAVTTAATVISLGTLTLTDNVTVSFDVLVTCTRQTLNTKRGTWGFSGQVARSSAGIAVLDSMTPGQATNINSAATLVTVDVDGANALRVRITPADTDGRNWRSWITYQLVTAA